MKQHLPCPFTTGGLMARYLSLFLMTFTVGCAHLHASADKPTNGMVVGRPVTSITCPGATADNPQGSTVYISSEFVKARDSALFAKICGDQYVQLSQIAIGQTYANQQGQIITAALESERRQQIDLSKLTYDQIMALTPAQMRDLSTFNKAAEVEISVFPGGGVAKGPGAARYGGMGMSYGYGGAWGFTTLAQSQAQALAGRGMGWSTDPIDTKNSSGTSKSKADNDALAQSQAEIAKLKREIADKKRLEDLAKAQAEVKK
jgi:hypothetical protein